MVDLDVASDESVARVVDGVIAEYGRIDVLVNNAGIGAAGAAEESSIEQAQHIFDVNVFGTIRMINAALPQLRRQGSGRVINVSSVLGLMPAPFMALYAATKHALEGYSESLDHEVREHGVRILLVEPFYTRTAFEANAVNPDRPLDLYEDRRTAARSIAASGVENGDAPAVSAAAIVAAATSKRPRLRNPAGPLGPTGLLVASIHPGHGIRSPDPQAQSAASGTVRTQNPRRAGMSVVRPRIAT